MTTQPLTPRAEACVAAIVAKVGEAASNAAELRMMGSRVLLANYDDALAAESALRALLAEYEARIAATEHRLATAMVALGAPDPRLATMKVIPFTEVIATGNHAFTGVARPLTPEQVAEVLEAAGASPSTEAGT